MASVPNNKYDNNDDFADWRFEAPSREYVLERRVQELETVVTRLEKELHRVKASDYGFRKLADSQSGIKGIRPSIGTLAGTINASLPQEPYKAD